MSFVQDLLNWVFQHFLEIVIIAGASYLIYKWFDKRNAGKVVIRHTLLEKKNE